MSPEPIFSAHAARELRELLAEKEIPIPVFLNWIIDMKIEILEGLKDEQAKLEADKAKLLESKIIIESLIGTDQNMRPICDRRDLIRDQLNRLEVELEKINFRVARMVKDSENWNFQDEDQ